MLYLRGVPVVQLRYHVAELDLLAADAGRSGQNGRSRKATLDTSAGDELSAAYVLRRGYQCRMSNLVARRDKHVRL